MDRELKKFRDYCDNLDEKEGYSEVIVLEKEGRTAVFNIIGSGVGAIVSRIDPREDSPEIAIFPSIDAGRNVLKNSIKTSIERGWTVVRKTKPTWDTTEE